ncbi:MAG: DUF4405 domain-containing protein [Raoultibacter sp.]
MKKNVIIDIVAFLVYALVANPALTGIGIHEWMSLGLLVVLFVHLLVHVDWVVDACKHLGAHLSWTRQGSLALNVVTFVVFVTVMVSGIGISGTVLATFGFYVEGYYFWNPLHAIAAKVLLALLLVHVVVHWKWLADIVRHKREDKNVSGDTSSDK